MILLYEPSMSPAVRDSSSDRRCRPHRRGSGLFGAVGRLSTTGDAARAVRCTRVVAMPEPDPSSERHPHPHPHPGSPASAPSVGPPAGGAGSRTDQGGSGGGGRDRPRELPTATEPARSEPPSGELPPPPTHPPSPAEALRLLA